MYNLILPVGFHSSNTHSISPARKLFLCVNSVKSTIIFKACLDEISFMFDTITYGNSEYSTEKQSEKWQYVLRRLWDLRRNLDDTSVSNIIAIYCVWIIHQSIIQPLDPLHENWGSKTSSSLDPDQ